VWMMYVDYRFDTREPEFLTAPLSSVQGQRSIGVAEDNVE
jgi:hypothetical protein